MFGRNEGGGQRFHTLLDEYLADQPVTVAMTDPARTSRSSG